MRNEISRKFFQNTRVVINFESDDGQCFHKRRGSAHFRLIPKKRIAFFFKRSAIGITLEKKSIGRKKIRKEVR